MTVNGTVREPTSDLKHMSELIVENLRKSYKTRTVVQDISLKIHSGEIVGLLGPNGAGKTTSTYDGGLSAIGCWPNFCSMARI